MSVALEVVDDPARACAAMLIGACSGGGHVVLTGGSTPRTSYEELVKAVRAVEVDLQQTTIWFGDERCVPPDDERSNYGMVKESLLDPLGPDNQPIVRRMEGELGPDDGAEKYEQALREAESPRFELVLLGIGPDGHTASLFPDQSTVHERSRTVVGVPQAGLEPFVPRVSMTFPTLARTEMVVVLASGAAKADAIAAAFGPEAKPNPHLPASMLPEFADEITILLDPAAASRL